MNLLVPLICGVIFFLSTPFSFADSRLDVVNSTLARMEQNRTVTATSALDSYSPVIAKRHIPPVQEHPKTPTDYEEESKAFKKKKAVEEALSVSLGYDRNHIHYSEWEGGDKLDEDFGYQGGFYASLAYTSPNYHEFFLGRPFFEGYYRKYSDVINYKGAIIGGGAFDYDQKSSVRRYGVKIGSYVDLIKDAETYFYMDIGHRRWHRGENETVAGVTCYAEIYEWMYYGIGGGISYFILPKLSLGLDWAGWFTADPKMKAYLYEGGTFKLGGTWGTEVKVPVKYYVMKGVSLDVTPYYTYWHISASDTVYISGSPYHEPDSNTNELGVLAGATYRF